jgi:hypothetical protein
MIVPADWRSGRRRLAASQGALGVLLAEAVAAAALRPELRERN